MLSIFLPKSIRDTPRLDGSVGLYMWSTITSNEISAQLYPDAFLKTSSSPLKSLEILPSCITITGELSKNWLFTPCRDFRTGMRTVLSGGFPPTEESVNWISELPFKMAANSPVAMVKKGWV